MNKLIVNLISVLLLFGFTNQLVAQSLTDSQTQLCEKQVDSVFQEMLVLAEKLDFDKLSLGVNDKHKAGFISSGKYYADYANLANEVETTAKGISHQDISIKDKTITVLSDNVVLLTASGSSSATINDGRTIVANFHWSFVYEKNNNDWKVIYSHQSLAE